MKDNIVDQFNEVLEILGDYPHIEDVIDLEAAQKFLLKLSESEIALTPSFKETNPDVFIKESKNSIQEWIDELNDLPGVCAWRDDYPGDGDIIMISVMKNLAGLSLLESDSPEDSTSEDEFTCVLSSGNRGVFQPENSSRVKEGTWAEIYTLIVEHVNESLTVPDIPEQND